MSSAFRKIIHDAYRRDCEAQNVDPSLNVLRWIELTQSFTDFTVSLPLHVNPAADVAAPLIPPLTSQATQATHYFGKSKFSTARVDEKSKTKLAIVLNLLRYIPPLTSLNFQSCGLSPLIVADIITFIEQTCDRQQSNSSTPFDEVFASASEAAKLSTKGDTQVLAKINLKGNKLTIMEFRRLCQIAQKFEQVTEILVDESSYYPSVVLAELCASNAERIASAAALHTVPEHDESNKENVSCVQFNSSTLSNAEQDRWSQVKVPIRRTFAAIMQSVGEGLSPTAGMSPLFLQFILSNLIATLRKHITVLNADTEILDVSDQLQLGFRKFNHWRRSQPNAETLFHIELVKENKTSCCRVCGLFCDRLALTFTPPSSEADVIEQDNILTVTSALFTTFTPQPGPTTTTTTTINEEFVSAAWLYRYAAAIIGSCSEAMVMSPHDRNILLDALNTLPFGEKLFDLANVRSATCAKKFAMLIRCQASQQPCGLLSTSECRHCIRSVPLPNIADLIAEIGLPFTVSTRYENFDIESMNKEPPSWYKPPIPATYDGKIYYNDVVSHALSACANECGSKNNGTLITDELGSSNLLFSDFQGISMLSICQNLVRAGSSHSSWVDVLQKSNDPNTPSSFDLIIFYLEFIRTQTSGAIRGSKIAFGIDLPSSALGAKEIQVMRSEPEGEKFSTIVLVHGACTYQGVPMLCSTDPCGNFVLMPRHVVNRFATRYEAVAYVTVESFPCQMGLARRHMARIRNATLTTHSQYGQTSDDFSESDIDDLISKITKPTLLRKISSVPMSFIENTTESETLLRVLLWLRSNDDKFSIKFQPTPEADDLCKKLLSAEELLIPARKTESLKYETTRKPESAYCIFNDEERRGLKRIREAFALGDVEAQMPNLENESLKDLSTSVLKSVFITDVPQGHVWKQDISASVMAYLLDFSTLKEQYPNVDIYDLLIEREFPFSPEESPEVVTLTTCAVVSARQLQQGVSAYRLGAVSAIVNWIQSLPEIFVKALDIAIRRLHGQLTNTVAHTVHPSLQSVAIPASIKLPSLPAVQPVFLSEAAVATNCLFDTILNPDCLLAVERPNTSPLYLRGDEKGAPFLVIDAMFGVAIARFDVWGSSIEAQVSSMQPFLPSVLVEASHDGGNYRKVATFPILHGKDVLQSLSLPYVGPYRFWKLIWENVDHLATSPSITQIQTFIHNQSFVELNSGSVGGSKVVGALNFTQSFAFPLSQRSPKSHVHTQFLVCSRDSNNRSHLVGTLVSSSDTFQKGIHLLEERLGYWSTLGLLGHAPCAAITSMNSHIVFVISRVNSQQYVSACHKTTGCMIETPFPVKQHYIFYSLPSMFGDRIDGAFPLEGSVVLIFSGFHFILFDIATRKPVSSTQSWHSNLPGRPLIEKNGFGNHKSVPPDNTALRFPFRTVSIILPDLSSVSDLLICSGSDAIRWRLPSVTDLVQHYISIANLSSATNLSKLYAIPECVLASEAAPYLNSEENVKEIIEEFVPSSQHVFQGISDIQVNFSSTDSEHRDQTHPIIDLTILNSATPIGSNSAPIISSPVSTSESVTHCDIIFRTTERIIPSSLILVGSSSGATLILEALPVLTIWPSKKHSRSIAQKDNRSSQTDSRRHNKATHAAAHGDWTAIGKVALVSTVSVLTVSQTSFPASVYRLRTSEPTNRLAIHRLLLCTRSFGLASPLPIPYAPYIFYPVNNCVLIWDGKARIVISDAPQDHMLFGMRISLSRPLSTEESSTLFSLANSKNPVDSIFRFTTSANSVTFVPVIGLDVTMMEGNENVIDVLFNTPVCARVVTLQALIPNVARDCSAILAPYQAQQASITPVSPSSEGEEGKAYRTSIDEYDLIKISGSLAFESASPISVTSPTFKSPAEEKKCHITFTRSDGKLISEQSLTDRANEIDVRLSHTESMDEPNAMLTINLSNPKVCLDSLSFWYPRYCVPVRTQILRNDAGVQSANTSTVSTLLCMNHFQISQYNPVGLRVPPQLAKSAPRTMKVFGFSVTEGIDSWAIRGQLYSRFELFNDIVNEKNSDILFNGNVNLMFDFIEIEFDVNAGQHDTDWSRISRLFTCLINPANEGAELDKAHILSESQMRSTVISAVEHGGKRVYANDSGKPILLPMQAGARVIYSSCLVGQPLLFSGISVEIVSEDWDAETEHITLSVESVDGKGHYDVAGYIKSTNKQPIVWVGDGSKTGIPPLAWRLVCASHSEERRNTLTKGPPRTSILLDVKFFSCPCRPQTTLFHLGRHNANFTTNVLAKTVLEDERNNLLAQIHSDVPEGPVGLRTLDLLATEGVVEIRQKSNASALGNSLKGNTQELEMRSVAGGSPSTTVLYVGAQLIGEPQAFTKVTIQTLTDANHEMAIQYSDDGNTFTTAAIHAQRDGWCTTRWRFCGYHKYWRVSASLLPGSVAVKRTRKSNASSASFHQDNDDRVLGSLMQNVNPSALASILWYAALPPAVEELPSPSQVYSQLIGFAQCQSRLRIPQHDSTLLLAFPIGFGVPQRHASVEPKKVDYVGSNFAQTLALEEELKIQQAMIRVVHGKVSSLAVRSATQLEERLDETLPRIDDVFLALDKSEADRLRTQLFPEGNSRITLDHAALHSGLATEAALPFVSAHGLLLTDVHGNCSKLISVRTQFVSPSMALSNNPRVTPQLIIMIENVNSNEVLKMEKFEHSLRNHIGLNDSILCDGMISAFDWAVGYHIPLDRGAATKMTKQAQARGFSRKVPLLLVSSYDTSFGYTGGSITLPNGKQLTSPYEIPIPAGNSIIVHCTTYDELLRFFRQMDALANRNAAREEALIFPEFDKSLETIRKAKLAAKSAQFESDNEFLSLDTPEFIESISPKQKVLPCDLHRIVTSLAVPADDIVVSITWDAGERSSFSATFSLPGKNLIGKHLQVKATRFTITYFLEPSTVSIVADSSILLPKVSAVTTLAATFSTTYNVIHGSFDRLLTGGIDTISLTERGIAPDVATVLCGHITLDTETGKVVKIGAFGAMLGSVASIVPSSTSSLISHAFVDSLDPKLIGLSHPKFASDFQLLSLSALKVLKPGVAIPSRYKAMASFRKLQSQSSTEINTQLMVDQSGLFANGFCWWNGNLRQCSLDATAKAAKLSFCSKDEEKPTKSLTISGQSCQTIISKADGSSCLIECASEDQSLRIQASSSTIKKHIEVQDGINKLKFNAQSTAEGGMEIGESVHCTWRTKWDVPAQTTQKILDILKSIAPSIPASHISISLTGFDTPMMEINGLLEDRRFLYVINLQQPIIEQIRSQFQIMYPKTFLSLV